MPVPARGPLQWREQTTSDRIREFVKSKNFLVVCAFLLIFLYLVWPTSQSHTDKPAQVGFQGDVKLGKPAEKPVVEESLDLAAEKAEDEASKAEQVKLVEEKKVVPIDRNAPKRSIPQLLKETEERASTKHDLVHSERILCEIHRGEIAADPSAPHSEASRCRVIGHEQQVPSPLQLMQNGNAEAHVFRVELRDHPNSNGGVVTVEHENCENFVGVHPQMYDSPALSQLFTERFGPDLLELRLVGPEFQVLPLEPLLDNALMKRNLQYPDLSFSCTYQATYHVAISGIYDLYVHLIHSKFEAIRFFPASHPRPQNAQLVHVPTKFIQAAPVSELIAEIRGRKLRHEQAVEKASSNYRGLTSSDGTVVTTPKDRSISGARAQPNSPFYHMMVSFLKQDFPFWQQSTARWIRNDTWLAMQHQHPREFLSFTLDGHGSVVPPFLETKRVEVYASGASSVLAPSNEGNVREFDWTHESTFHPLADLNRYRLMPLVQWSQYVEINQPVQADAHKWIQAEEDKFLTDPAYEYDPHSFQLPDQGKLDAKCEILRLHELNLRVAETKARETLGPNYNPDYASLATDFLKAEYTAEDLSYEFTGCIGGKNLLFVGDEHMGQLFQQVVRTIGGDDLYQIHERSGKSPIGTVQNPEIYPGMECVAVVPSDGRAVQRKVRNSDNAIPSISDPNTRLCFIYSQDLDTLATQSIKIPLTNAEQAAAPGEKYRYSSFWDLLHMRGEPNKLFAHIFLNFGVWPARRAMTFEVYADELNEFMERYQLELRARLSRYSTRDANDIGRKGLFLLDPFPIDGLPRGRDEMILAPARLHRQLTFIGAFMHPRVFHQDVGATAAEHRTASDRRTALTLALYNELAQTILSAYDVPVLDSPFQQSYLWVDQLALKEDRLAVYRDQMEERLITELEKEVEKNPTLENMLRVRKFKVKREKLKAKSKAAAAARQKQDTDQTIIPVGLESRPAALAAHLARRRHSASVSVNGNELAPHGVFLYGGRIMSSVSSELFFHIKKVFKCPTSLVMRNTLASQARMKEQIRNRENYVPTSPAVNPLKDRTAPYIRIRQPSEYWSKYHREVQAAINAGRPEVDASGVSKGSNPEMDARNKDLAVEYDKFFRVVSLPAEKHLWPKDVIEEPPGSGNYRQLTLQEKSVMEANNKKQEVPQSNEELMKRYQAAVAQAEIDEKKEDEEEERAEYTRKQQATYEKSLKAQAKQSGNNGPRLSTSKGPLDSSAYLPRKFDPIKKGLLTELNARRAELQAKIKAKQLAEAQLKSKMKGKTKSKGRP